MNRRTSSIGGSLLLAAGPAVSGKAGILFELDAKTGQLLWKLPVGGHDGHENDGLLTENAKPGSHVGLPASFCLVIARAGASLVPSQQRMIIAYKLGATGKLPDTVGS
jgi:hypothetical protein